MQYRFLSYPDNSPSPTIAHHVDIGPDDWVLIVGNGPGGDSSVASFLLLGGGGGGQDPQMYRQKEKNHVYVTYSLYIPGYSKCILNILTAFWVHSKYSGPFLWPARMFLSC